MHHLKNLRAFHAVKAIPYITFMTVNKLNMQGLFGNNMDRIYMDPGARVADNIYIGSLATATSKYCLDNLNIDAIVNLSGAEYKSSRPVYNIIMDDVTVLPSTLDSYVEKFSQGTTAITYCTNNRKNVLVHCAAGINRSATLIAFYLINCGWTYENAVGALAAANSVRGVPLLTNDSFRYLLQTRDSFRRNFDKK